MRVVTLVGTLPAIAVDLSADSLKFAGLALLALAAAAYLAQPDSGAHSKFGSEVVTADSVQRICNPHDPFTPCAGATRPMYPAGGGLYFTLDELT